MIKSIIRLLLFPALALSILLCSCSYDSLGNKEKEKIEDYSKQILEQASIGISLMAEKIENQCYDVVLSEPVQERTECEDDYDKLMNSRQVSDLLISTFINIKDIEMVFVEFSEGGTDSYRLNDYVDYEEVKALVKPDKNGSFKWVSVKIKERNFVVLSKKITSITTANEIGKIYVVLKDSYFQASIKNIRYGNDSRVFILDSGGKIISTANKDSDSEIDGIELIHKIKNYKMHSNMFTTVINKVENLVVYSEIKNRDWYVVGIIPVHNLYQR